MNFNLAEHKLRPRHDCISEVSCNDVEVQGGNNSSKPQSVVGDLGTLCLLLYHLASPFFSDAVRRAATITKKTTLN